MSSEHPKEFYCAMGCNDAITKYSIKLRNQLGTPPAPGLVPDTLNATSLRLEWNFPEAKNLGIGYLLQWTFDEHQDWQYCNNQTWSPHNTVFIENLQPYTKYKVCSKNK